jgi:hypothetical protein
MNKIEKIQEEIRMADARIRHNEEVIAAAEEVLKRPDADAEIVRLQTAIEEKRNKRAVTSSANYLITSWKRENIENPKLWIDSAKKYKQTMQAKIDAAIK